MTVRPEERVSVRPDALTTVSGWWARERCRTAELGFDWRSSTTCSCVADGWKLYEGIAQRELVLASMLVELVSYRTLNSRWKDGALERLDEKS